MESFSTEGIGKDCCLFSKDNQLFPLGVSDQPIDQAIFDDERFGIKLEQLDWKSLEGFGNLGVRYGLFLGHVSLPERIIALVIHAVNCLTGMCPVPSYSGKGRSRGTI
jgi:hypothetical protein